MSSAGFTKEYICTIITEYCITNPIEKPVYVKIYVIDYRFEMYDNNWYEMMMDESCHEYLKHGIIWSLGKLTSLRCVEAMSQISQYLIGDDFVKILIEYNVALGPNIPSELVRYYFVIKLFISKYIIYNKMC